jgi:hypothetical protein
MQLPQTKRISTEASACKPIAIVSQQKCPSETRDPKRATANQDASIRLINGERLALAVRVIHAITVAQPNSDAWGYLQ